MSLADFREEKTVKKSIDRVSLEARKEIYKEIWKTYKTKWQLADNILYDLCKQPDNRINQVFAECFLIGRSYGTRIESHIYIEKGKTEIENEKNAERENLENNALSILSSKLYSGLNMEFKSDFHKLCSLKGELSAETLIVIALLHKGLVDFLEEVTRIPKNSSEKLSPRSFVSKFLHFHNPIVPIYDSRATGSLNKHVYEIDCDKNLWSLPRADQDYREFIARFFVLYKEASEFQGEEYPNSPIEIVKALDQYLWYYKDKDQNKKT